VYTKIVVKDNLKPELLV